MLIGRTEQLRYRRFRPAVRVARTAAREVAQRWGLAGLADDAESVVGELMANAVVHGRAARESWVAVTYELADEALRIEVRDWATGLPRLPLDEVDALGTECAEDMAESGRGLLMVSALCARWGVTPHVIGKSVWCEFASVPQVLPER
ncbi:MULTISPECIES: ATP-binding protein [Streptomyces]|uniref:Histidine kinase/HSP90-like ATPase domain-containing protein n=1 Tax=Streptomyces albus (strain ATCC 21838 / DSM 41398 / FERM P-419 / JCM 4703 / NBRC 107858) TaxID=1081613 RepID=A0A0B5F6D4_STRA4|nr:ATP-binding protein [Streptomyces sp. SCSIO ZS0520]AJE85887.1 hypothetical protein SLNWT_5511 [Streptomyces albus]AOU80190.1 hypothetical protein SLNHY_5499 [Streptomyces albus]AYN35906.1 ATP-binding protein [Streptomyces albus]